MKRLFYIICPILILTYCSTIENPKDEEQTIDILNDLKVAVVNDTAFLKWLTTPPVQTWQPDSADWKQIDNILRQAESDSIFTFLKIPTLENMRKHYYRQYAFYINDKGHKVVYINALCEIREHPKETENGIQWNKIDWKSHIVQVLDGGICYWQMQINLDEKKYFDFGTNGEA